MEKDFYLREAKLYQRKLLQRKKFLKEYNNKYNKISQSLADIRTLRKSLKKGSKNDLLLVSIANNLKTIQDNDRKKASFYSGQQQWLKAVTAYHFSRYHSYSDNKKKSFFPFDVIEDVELSPVVGYAIIVLSVVAMLALIV